MRGWPSDRPNTSRRFPCSSVIITTTTTTIIITAWSCVWDRIITAITTTIIITTTTTEIDGKRAFV